VRRSPLLLLACLLLCVPGAVVAEPNASPQLADGLTWESLTLSIQGRQIPVRVIRRSTTASLQLLPAVPAKGLRQPATLRDIAHQQGAVAAINGGFFGPGGFPIGTIVINGQVASFDTRSRSAIGLLKSGQYQIAPLEAKAFVTFDDYFEPIWLWGYNQPLKSGAVVLYNQWLGASQVSLSGTQRGMRLMDGRLLAPASGGSQSLGGAPPMPETPVEESGAPKRVVISNRDLPSSTPHRPTLPTGPAVLGFNESAHPALRRAKDATAIYEGVVLPPHWKQATHLLTAGPLIVQQGQVQRQESNPEGFSRDILGSATRSVVGISRSGELLLIQFPQPVTLEEAAYGAVTLGCQSALNLDGGGSIGLWARLKDGSELCYGCNGRRLGSALVIVEGSGRQGALVPYFDGSIFQHWQAIRAGQG